MTLGCRGLHGSRQLLETLGSGKSLALVLVTFIFTLNVQGRGTPTGFVCQQPLRQAAYAVLVQVKRCLYDPGA